MERASPAVPSYTEALGHAARLLLTAEAPGCDHLERDAINRLANSWMTLATQLMVGLPSPVQLHE